MATAASLCRSKAHRAQMTGGAAGYGPAGDILKSSVSGCSSCTRGLTSFDALLSALCSRAMRGEAGARELRCTIG